MSLTWEALAERRAPSWFSDAKLGLLVCWGPWSVPAWAPVGAERPRVVQDEGWEAWFSRNPQAEWYANTMQIAGSPTQAHHRARWGRMTRYESFARELRQSVKAWDPSPVMDAAVSAGARYVVLTAKHHDGFLLWPSRRRNPRHRGWQLQRDALSEMADAARAQKLRVGVYYSGGMDWTFRGSAIKSFADLRRATPRSRAYADYVEAHWRELIQRVEPSLLWNDVGSPPSLDLLRLFNEYYDAVPDGVVNDRFGPADADAPGLIGRVVRSAVSLLHRGSPARSGQTLGTPEAPHADFLTYDYGVAASGEEKPWECVRGLGSSFGWNSAAPDESLVDTVSLVRTFVDVVARGGNLLLAVGPGPGGALDASQARRLAGLGEWLKLNGEAVYGSRPWGGQEAETPDGVPIRYTTRGMTTYAILLGTPPGRTIVLPSLRLLPQAGVRILGSLAYVTWFQEGKDVHVKLAEPLKESAAHVISITPQPRP